MSKDDVLRLALDALTFRPASHADYLSTVTLAADAIRAALAEPEPEPAAWMVEGFGALNTEDEARWRARKEGGLAVFPLYTAPPRRVPDADAAVREIARLKAALAESEPVAWEHHGRFGFAKLHPDARPLYTAPPKRKPLTEDQIDAIGRDLNPTPGLNLTGYTRRLVRAVERAIIGGQDE